MEPNKDTEPEGPAGITTLDLEQIARGVQPPMNPNAQIGMGSQPFVNPNAQIGFMEGYLNNTPNNMNLHHPMGNAFVNNSLNAFKVNEPPVASMTSTVPFQQMLPSNLPPEASMQPNPLLQNMAGLRNDMLSSGLNSFPVQQSQVPSNVAKFSIANPGACSMMPVQGRVPLQSATPQPKPIQKLQVQTAPKPLPGLTASKPVKVSSPVKPKPAVHIVKPTQPIAQPTQPAQNQGMIQKDSNLFDAKKMIAAGTLPNTEAKPVILSQQLKSTEPVISNQKLNSESITSNHLRPSNLESLYDKKRPGEEVDPTQVKKMKPSDNEIKLASVPDKPQSTQTTSSASTASNSTSEKVKQGYSSTYHISPTNDTDHKSIHNLVKLDKIPDVPPLPKLNTREIVELEKLLQFRDRYNTDPDDGWKDDWSGNLQFIERDIVINRDKLVERIQTKPITKMFREVVAENAKDGSMESFRGIRWLFSYIYYMNGTPPMARKIMAFSLYRPAISAQERLEFIMKGIRRISYDPIVLHQDGWTTTQQGSKGGACLIGRRVLWHRFEAVIIAFVRDDEIGDLWKAMWLEDNETFDLEADELQEAIKKWETKENRKKAKLLSNNVPPAESTANSAKKSSVTTSTRHAVTNNFNVEGIEHGIVLAMSYDANARPSIFWPARVMHVSEHHTLGLSGPPSRRNAAKNQIPVIFLAPFWNTQTIRKIDANTGPDIFSAGPLFHFESVDISNTSIKKYPYDGDIKSLSIDNLRNEFKFLGLPKGAFHRFLDAHRLAISLKAYAQEQLSRDARNGVSDHSSAYAALTDSHPMSVKTAIFPPVILSLPYAYILSCLPAPVEQASKLTSDEEIKEPVIKLHKIVEAMEPPLSVGDTNHTENYKEVCPSTPSASLKSMATPDITSSTNDSVKWSIDNFASSFLLSKIITNTPESNGNSKILNHLETNLNCLITRLNDMTVLLRSKEINLEARKQRIRSFADNCMLIKTLGEDFVSSYYASAELVKEWRKTCERIFKCAVAEFSVTGLGNGVSVVITDSRCNQHLTSVGSFERPVRIPAAIKGAKLAGCGKSESFKLNTKIDDKYIDIAEKKILPQAHKASYLKRIKTKIAALPSNVRGHPLTDDSEGEGGEDTMGSRGSYTAAVIGVAAGLQAVDMVVNGECVNVFCATRPPGHHAGRELRPMNAISNGFCLLNGAACAAIYATTPISDGGRGLKRACVIDFDVHHGNGTQDILCSTYDPRFLYVSLHAGGPHINGFDDDIFNHARRNSATQEGIFPGRCGDTSPHPGVLNVPLGQRVTAHLMGNALVSQVAPAVEAFSPDIIIISAGFDGHKNDPLGLGGLSAEDFGSITDVACQMAAKTCSGRLISILEGGYGVPCCRPKSDLFLPDSMKTPDQNSLSNNHLDNFLGDELPSTMDDEVPDPLKQKLERCTAEGFLESVKEHVASLARNNTQSHQKK